MGSDEIQFFDLACKGDNACWSLNPWKTRLVLNLKEIPYKTTWLEYPEVAPKLKSLGLAPNEEGAAYTIPAIRLPDGKAVMDSRLIAAELEKLCPSPSLHLDSPVLPKVEALIPKAMMATLRGVVMPKIPRNLLNPPSAEYFEETRAKRFGCPLEELEKKTPEDEAWNDAEPGIHEMGSLLKQQGGPFFLGKTVSYADLVVVGALQFLKSIEERLFERMIGVEPCLKTLYDACESYLGRKSH